MPTVMSTTEMATPMGILMVISRITHGMKTTNLQLQLPFVAWGCDCPAGSVTNSPSTNFSSTKATLALLRQTTGITWMHITAPHGKHGTVITKHGYFLKDTDLTQFDPSMFSITAAEAEQLDPSQQENQEHIKAIVDIRVVISISAPLDTNAPELRIPRPRTFIGTRPPPPREAEARIRAYIKNILPGAIRTESKPTAEMWELVLCVSQQAYLPRLFGVKGSGQKAALSGIMESLEKWKEERGKGLPALWIVHGSGDTMVS